MFPGNIAIVLDFETDSRLRTLGNVRNIVKKSGGNVTPTAYLFEKKGQLVFTLKEGMADDDAFDVAVDAGAEDVIAEDGKLIVFTAPTETKVIAEKVASNPALEIESSEIIYDPIEDTKSDVDADENLDLLKIFADRVQEESGLLAMYTNARPVERLESRYREVLDTIA